MGEAQCFVCMVFFKETCQQCLYSCISRLILQPNCFTQMLLFLLYNKYVCVHTHTQLKIFYSYRIFIIFFLEHCLLHSFHVDSLFSDSSLKYFLQHSLVPVSSQIILSLSFFIPFSLLKDLFSPLPKHLLASKLFCIILTLNHFCHQSFLS